MSVIVQFGLKITSSFYEQVAHAVHLDPARGGRSVSIRALRLDQLQHVLCAGFEKQPLPASVR